MTLYKDLYAGICPAFSFPIRTYRLGLVLPVPAGEAALASQFVPPPSSFPALPHLHGSLSIAGGYYYAAVDDPSRCAEGVPLTHHQQTNTCVVTHRYRL